MEINAIPSAGVTVIHIVGSVDSLTCSEVEDFLQKRVQEGEIRLVADLSQVDYLSSAGLRVLLTTLKSARQKGGNFHLAAVQAGIERVLSLAGFAHIFKIFPTVEEGVAGF